MKNKQVIISSMLLVILFFFTSCNTKTKEKVEEKIVVLPKHLINRIDIHQLEIIEIDNCEYIFYKKAPNRNMGFGFMSHKGNCKNPIHYYNRNKVTN
jgi:predicted RNA-binding Zn ribbon-like protein